MRALLLIPPTGLFFREDRCQTPIDSPAFAQPPITLTYMAAALEQAGAQCHVRDYPVSGGSWDDLESDVAALRPDLVLLAPVASTFESDLRAASIAKRLRPRAVTLIKAGYLTPDEAAESIDAHPDLDIALMGEYEATLQELLPHLGNGMNIAAVEGIVYREAGASVFTGFRKRAKDLDTLPFPARHLIDNTKYTRPDTREPQAIIQTSRGCPAECTFCLAPRIEGRTIRSRAPENILEELRQCVEVHNIRNFFFRADTFTWNKPWLIDLCRRIVESGLKIQWVCNSRVDTLDAERIDWMKRAGCWGMALGIESGNQQILDSMKKGITLAQSRTAVRLCREQGIATYLFFLLGVPQDTRDTILETIRFARALRGDFYLFHMAVPFRGTELHREAQAAGLLAADALEGFDHFSPAMRSGQLTQREILRLWRRANLSIWLNPSYVWRILRRIRSPRVFFNYLRYGLDALRGFVRARADR